MSGAPIARTPVDPIDAPVLLSSRAAARLLGIGERTLTKLRATGRIPPPLHIGRTVRWPRATLERWVALGCPSAERFADATRGGAGG